MNDNIFRLFLVLAYIITKLFTFQVLFAQFYVFSTVHDAHSLHDKVFHILLKFVRSNSCSLRFFLDLVGSFYDYPRLIRNIRSSRRHFGSCLASMTPLIDASSSSEEAEKSVTSPSI